MRSKKIVLWVLVLITVGVASCMKSVDNQDEIKVTENDNTILKYLSDSIKAAKDPSGYYYLKRKTNAAGDTAKLGDAATVKLTGYIINDNGTASTVPVTSDTVSFPVGAGTLIYGVELGIGKVRTGEKISLFLPYYLAFGNSARTNIPAYSAIRMEMEFIKTRNEVQQINDYIAKKKFTVYERTTDNLVIIRTDTSKAVGIGAGKSVTVKYVGRFLDDTKFDEGSFPMTTGTGSVITGFDQAVQRMPAKGKAIVVFPSALGYKAAGNSSIPPYSPLMFELELQ